jgi:c-di-GMP-binding flagellar brake protein YcgR
VSNPAEPARSGTAAAAAHDFERFQIHDRLEIAGILRTLVERRALVTVVYGNGSLFFVSAVLALSLDRNEVIVDSAPDDDAHGKVLASERLTLATLLDNIRVQFHATKTRDTVFEGQRALRMPIPETVMRLQRRESYRLRVPPVGGPCCDLRVDPADSAALLRLPLFDISCGGLSLVDWPEGRAPENHHIYRACRLHLDADDVLTTDLEVVYVIDRTETDGARVRRCGARFVDLPGKMVTRVQRYITRLERDLKAQREAADAPLYDR